MNFFSFRKSADAPNLDVDNPAGVGFQGEGRRARIYDGFIQANGRTQFFLQAGMREDVVVP